MKALITRHPVLISAVGSIVALVVVLGSIVFVDARGLDASEPIDWDSMERTDTGFRESGILVDFEFDCTTGQLRANTPLFDFDVMTVDPPWVAKHKTDEACERHGFDPQF